MTRIDIPSEPPRTGWDIHCHTVFSDGTETPATLVEQGKGLGLLGVGISDHDTTAGWHDAEDAASRCGVPLLRGTEITADDEGISVHMLAFQYDPRSRHICELFEATRAARLKRVRRMVELLSADYPITWNSVLEQVREGEKTTVGRPHIADALVAAGVYPTRSDAFSDVVSTSSKYYIPTPSPSTHEVVRAVGEAGGVTVIAHAGDLSRNARLLSDRQIERLIGEGLDGLEVWHRGNPPEQRERLLAIARRHGLLVTGGSDWHGKGKPNALGENLTDEATVVEIVRRGAIPLWK
ncbi:MULTISPECIES: PHP domain-containing protein [Bifidobacterium]|uniref:PHP domain-containing protein n=1 Tax=Bifidobacterium TaxID=1678 RepID=UPI001BDCEEE1|nr:MULTISPECIES: PHP domain-containing protein [Bifidobacterium]MBT1161142.1 PHP domain-containing protein [Bifidobacterium sp. SO1]MBW3078216.1 PHP domain-containing protein [Bifidobacterium simiiventris]